jgi:protein SCO1
MTRFFGLKLSLGICVSACFLLSHNTFAENIPAELQGVGVEEHLGSSIDLNSTFKDENGTPVQLKKYFNGVKPVLFFLVYYDCPNLCTFVLNATIDSIKNMTLTASQDFEVVAVSIDPREKPSLAKTKLQAYLKAYDRPAGNIGWHFLTGDQEQITKISNQIGFKYKWDKEQNQFAHTSSMFVLTGDGKISRYFYGISYPTQDMKVSILEAGHGRIGTIVDKILLFCYHYDASTKKYVLMATRIMSVGGAMTVLILGGYLAMNWRRERTLHA